MFIPFITVLLKSRYGHFFTLGDSITACGADDRLELLHRTGTSLTDLRPGGRALIDGCRVDVVASTGFINVGTPIRVINVAGNQMKVEVDTAIPTLHENDPSQL